MSLMGEETCPVCGSHDVVPIMYGLPSPEAEEDAMNGKVVLGGCVVEENSPTLYCKSCEHNWYDESYRQW
jgi:hypothetical protein